MLKISGATVQNVIPSTKGRLEFLHPWLLIYVRGYAPTSYTDFDCIWHYTSHNFPTTTTIFSNSCPYSVMCYGCHRQTDRQTDRQTYIHDMPSYFITYIYKRISSLRCATDMRREIMDITVFWDVMSGRNVPTFRNTLVMEVSRSSTNSVHFGPPTGHPVAENRTLKIN
jgi:hypothetical protein